MLTSKIDPQISPVLLPSRPFYFPFQVICKHDLNSITSIHAWHLHPPFLAHSYTGLFILCSKNFVTRFFHVLLLFLGLVFHELAESRYRLSSCSYNPPHTTLGPYNAHCYCDYNWFQTQTLLYELLHRASDLFACAFAIID